MISVEVAAPGRSGSPASSQASSSRSVAPGETPNPAPASTAFATSSGVSSVPAPTTPPSTAAISRMASSAAGVRSVTSSAGRPPATSARASGAAWAACSTTSTGITGAMRQMSRALSLASVGVIASSVRMRPVIPLTAPERKRSLRRRPRLPLALVRIEEPLAQPDRLRRDLDQFVVVDVGDRLFERQRYGRGEPHRVVGAARADIGELLALERVHLEIVLARMLADDHAGVDLLLRADEHAPPLFEVPERVGHRDAVFHRDQHARAPARDRALVRRPAVEHAV